MPILKITGQGLSAIALSVALLWGCWIVQHALQRRDSTERARVLRDLEILRTNHVPPGYKLSAVPPRLRV